MGSGGEVAVTPYSMFESRSREADMILCPDTALAVEVCDCDQRHLCPVCGLPVPENAEDGEERCTCSEEEDDEQMAILEDW